MTLYDILMALCVVFVVGVLLKGFWRSTGVKPINQRDNWDNDASPKDD